MFLFDANGLTVQVDTHHDRGLISGFRVLISFDAAPIRSWREAGVLAKCRCERTGFAKAEIDPDLRHRHRGMAVEGDSDGTREVLVPDMRDDHAAAGAVPCHSARLRRTKPAGHDPV